MLHKEQTATGSKKCLYIYLVSVILAHTSDLMPFGSEHEVIIALAIEIAMGKHGGRVGATNSMPCYNITRSPTIPHPSPYCDTRCHTPA